MKASRHTVQSNAIHSVIVEFHDRRQPKNETPWIYVRLSESGFEVRSNGGPIPFEQLGQMIEALQACEREWLVWKKERGE